MEQSSYVNGSSKGHCGAAPDDKSFIIKEEMEIKDVDSFPETHTEEKKPFLCKDCGKAFSCNIHLERHARIHTADRVSGVASDKKSLFIKEGIVIKDVHSFHEACAEDKPFLCKECGKAFSCGVHLERHARIHTADKLFSCEECGKAFSCSIHLKRHARIHTAGKPFSCEECGKAFSLKDSLKKHLRIHKNKASVLRVLKISSPSAPLTYSQKIFFVRLIKAHPIITAKTGDYEAILRRKKAWEEVGKQFNIKFSLSEPKTVKQLKRAWEWLQRRLKKNQAEYMRKLRQTGSGPPPTPPKMDELMELVLEVLKICDFMPSPDEVLEDSHVSDFIPNSSNSLVINTSDCKLSDGTPFKPVKQQTPCSSKQPTPALYQEPSVQQDTAISQELPTITDVLTSLPLSSNSSNSGNTKSDSHQTVLGESSKDSSSISEAELLKAATSIKVKRFQVGKTSGVKRKMEMDRSAAIKMCRLNQIKFRKSVLSKIGSVTTNVSDVMAKALVSVNKIVDSVDRQNESMCQFQERVATALESQAESMRIHAESHRIQAESQRIQAESMRRIATAFECFVSTSTDGNPQSGNTFTQ